MWSKGLPSKMPVNTMGSKSVKPGMRNPVDGVQKQPPPKGVSYVPKHSLDQRKDVRELHKSKILPRPPPRPPVASSKAQVSKPPLKQIPKRPGLHDPRPKSKPMKRHLEEPEDDTDVTRMIRSMFNYNPSIFIDDDNVDNMKAVFNEIVREEKRSSLIAKKEDGEQLRLIEEGERARGQRIKEA